MSLWCDVCQDSLIFLMIYLVLSAIVTIEMAQKWKVNLANNSGFIMFLLGKTMVSSSLSECLSYTGVGGEMWTVRATTRDWKHCWDEMFSLWPTLQTLLHHHSPQQSSDQRNTFVKIDIIHGIGEEMINFIKPDLHLLSNNSPNLRIETRNLK